MDECYLDFSLSDFFFDIYYSYPKIFCPNLQLLLLDELKKIPIPGKPKPPIPPGCLGSVFGATKEYLQKYMDYKKQLEIIDHKCHNARKGLANKLLNPHSDLQSSIQFLHKAIEKSTSLT
jgi:hypothetical protein